MLTHARSPARGEGVGAEELGEDLVAVEEFDEAGVDLADPAPDFAWDVARRTACDFARRAGCTSRLTHGDYLR